MGLSQEERWCSNEAYSHQVWLEQMLYRAGLKQVQFNVVL